MTRPTRSFALVTSHGAVDSRPRRAHLARDLSLVAIGITAMAPFTVGWDPVLRAFVLTLVVVPLAVYWSCPGSRVSTIDIWRLVDRLTEGLLEERPNARSRTTNRMDHPDADDRRLRRRGDVR